ncbi:hypothetical protein Trydic_g5959 [Trypoxylus dichotomus]
MDLLITDGKQLTQKEIDLMEAQNSRLVTPFQAESLEKNARKHWDLFYKRNEDKFFRDRHWTTREFKELLDSMDDSNTRKILLEIGCGHVIYHQEQLKWSETMNCTINSILLRPGGVLLFRDYGLYDMAQLRFKAGHKIAENFYMRQDGTRSYYFSTSFLEKIVTEAGFKNICSRKIYEASMRIPQLRCEEIIGFHVWIDGNYYAIDRLNQNCGTLIQKA